VPYQPEDLSPLECALLGVLMAGLPPSRSAGSDTFRVDHVAAVVHGLQTTGNRDEFLSADGVQVTAEFRGSLRAAIASLAAREIVANAQGAMPAAAGGFEAGLQIDLVNPDEHAAVLDRYLAQLCMETLFNKPAVYPFLMERYAASGEIWRRLREQGYGS
jgi:hypothetical protein